MIYHKANLTDFQECVNAAAVELALQSPALVRKGNRGELLEVAQKEVTESYTFKKNGKDKVPTPKRPKFEREMRDNRVTELNEVIVDLTKRIAIKESRCQQAEIACNYKLCDQLNEDIMELKSEKRLNEKELLIFKKKKKEKRSVRCQEVKCRKLLESPDTASRSRSTTPGLASTPLSPLSPLSNFTGSYSCDASASSESESTVMSQVHIVQLPSQDRDFSCRNQWVMSQKQAQVVRMVACPVQQGQCLLKVSTPLMSQTCIFSTASSWYITQHGGAY